MTPTLYLVDLARFTLYMQHIDAPSVRDMLVEWQNEKPSTESMDLDEKVISISRMIGSGLARIHDLNIIHGDLTTSNLLIRRELDQQDIIWIDFGLSYTSTMHEDKGTTSLWTSRY